MHGILDTSYGMIFSLYSEFYFIFSMCSLDSDWDKCALIPRWMAIEQWPYQALKLVFHRSKVRTVVGVLIATLIFHYSNQNFTSWSSNLGIPFTYQIHLNHMFPGVKRHLWLPCQHHQKEIVKFSLALWIQIDENPFLKRGFETWNLSVHQLLHV